MSRSFGCTEGSRAHPRLPARIGGIQTLVWRLAVGFSRFRPRVVTTAAAGARTFDRQQPFEVVRVPASPIIGSPS